MCPTRPSIDSVDKHTRLTEVTISGFKSIREARIRFTDLNILIGPNGAGKSNLIAFFRMMSYMMASPSGSLQRYIAEQGGANALLHDGSKKTQRIEANVVLQTTSGRNDYHFVLSLAAPDTLIFTDEACRFSKVGLPENPNWLSLGIGQREAAILQRTEKDIGLTRMVIASLLREFAVYQFHDTSREARIKSTWDYDDCRYLRGDAANIAPFLSKLQEQYPDYYRRIVETIRQVAPFFDDFVLEPDFGRIMLRWRETGSDVIFTASQAADGTLRAMALVVALLQPPEKLPALLVIDEPELGLHPYAIAIIGGLIKSVAKHRQVIIATQSPLMLDQFNVEDIVVVQRPTRDSEYERLDPTRLKEWLEEYTLGDLWNKNVIGGRPIEAHS